MTVCRLSADSHHCLPRYSITITNHESKLLAVCLLTLQTADKDTYLYAMSWQDSARDLTNNCLFLAGAKTELTSFISTSFLQNIEKLNIEISFVL